MARLRLPPLMQFPVPEHPWSRLPAAEAWALADAERERLGLPKVKRAGRKKAAAADKKNPYHGIEAVKW